MLHERGPNCMVVGCMREGYLRAGARVWPKEGEVWDQPGHEKEAGAHLELYIGTKAQIRAAAEAVERGMVRDYHPHESRDQWSYDRRLVVTLFHACEHEDFTP